MAKYFSTDKDQRKHAVERVRYAFINRLPITIIVHSKTSKQDRSQKNYLHVLLQILSMKTGYTFDFCKYDYFKRSCNPDFFIYDRANPITGEIAEALRSTEDPAINLTMAIERLKNRTASDYGFKLPEPNNKAELEHYEYLAQFYEYF